MKYLLKKIIMLPCFGMMILLSSCPGPHNREALCYDGTIYLYGAGFNASDFTYGMVYKYKQDNLFDSVIDSQLFQLNVTGNDTFQLNTTYGPLTAKYDYSLKLPGINKTYTISHITQTGRNYAFVSGNSGGVCLNRIVSALINDSTVVYTDTGYSAPPPTGIVPDTLYIHK